MSLHKKITVINFIYPEINFVPYTNSGALLGVQLGLGF
jgi:hypothetical protein